ncbi:ClpP/crotonase [Fistulina hepatica ATCC 64428]|nr:ClpP/crotonase [Fistulina hepatica ATCC 64428]
MSSSYPFSLPADNPLVTVTYPKDYLWVIELHNGQDNRLTVGLINDGLKPALDQVERHWRAQWRMRETKNSTTGAKVNDGRGAVIIVGRRDQDKFFSNGLDFANSSKDMNFFPLTFNPLLTRILTFPIPTIAAINGHCFAGGCMLSLACDYRVMTDGSKRNAWMCMNEVHFGAVWPLSFAVLLRAKVGDGILHRKIALEGHRFTPREALEAGLVDHIVVGNTEAVLAKAEEVADAVAPNAKTGVWGMIKSDLYQDALKAFQKDPRLSNADLADAAARARL